MNIRMIFVTAISLTLLAIPSIGQRGGGPPRRLENPETIQLEHGARVEFKEFESEALKRKSAYSVFSPPSYDKEPERRFPVVYFLHGMNNDHTSWAVGRYGNLPSLLEKLMMDKKIPEFLMINPNGERSFYTDYQDGSQNFEQMVTKDLIAEVEGHFRTKTDRNSRALGGTSMGGYGALKIAMKYPDLYSTVVAGSPIVLLGDDPMSALSGNPRAEEFFSGVFSTVFGKPFDAEYWKKNSVERLARTSSLDGLRILVLYGTADRYNGLIPMEAGVRELDQILSKRQIPHQVKIYDNEPHGWELIDNHFDEVIDFLTQTFQLAEGQ